MGLSARPKAFLGCFALLHYAMAQAWGNWTPGSRGFSATMDSLYQQIIRMPTSQWRFDGLLNIAAAGLLVPNFTKRGWDVVKQPPEVHRLLNATLHEGLQKGAREEGRIDQIAGQLPKFVPIGALSSHVTTVLKPLHEEWAGGVKLEFSRAYGLRVYQDGNQLTMHIDHHDTHVISSILHVDRDVDEPWPIVITGYDGVTVEYDLQPGDMLFYESAKCIHGRPRAMKGRWYSSLFVHYRPVHLDVSHQKVVSAVGEHHHHRAGPDDNVPKLEMVGTGFLHPECDHGWCGLAKTWPPLDARADGFDPTGLHPVERTFADDSSSVASLGSSGVAIYFKNAYKDGVNVYWVPPDGQPLVLILGDAMSSSNSKFEFGSTCFQSTFSGHVFQAWDGDAFVNEWQVNRRMHMQTISVLAPKSEL